MTLKSVKCSDRFAVTSAWNMHQKSRNKINKKERDLTSCKNNEDSKDLSRDPVLNYWKTYSEGDFCFSFCSFYH